MPCNAPMTAAPWGAAQAALVGRRYAPSTLTPRTGPPPGNGGIVPPGHFPPSCGPFYPPGCSPCPPSPEAAMAEAAAYDLACRADQAQTARAARAQVLAGQPQAPLAVRTAAGTVIPAGGTQTFSAIPTIPMCLTRFLIPRAFGQFVLVNSMRAARQELLADGAGVPGDSFAPDALVVPILELPTLYPGTPITLSIENIDLADHPFYAVWWGVPLAGAMPCL